MQTNTAKKHEFENTVVQSLLHDYKAQGVVSNLILKPVEEMLLTRDHWGMLAGLTTDPKQKEYYEMLQAQIDTLMVVKQQLSLDVYGANNTGPAILDAMGVAPKIG